MSLFPIVERELRVASRRPATYWTRFWFSLVTLLVWLLILENNRSTTMTEMGQLLLNAIGIIILAFSLFAGVLLTADSIAEERREGTLGLLFLTNLRAANVVFGKMSAYSLNSVFGLLAVFPVLGLTILLGGVTAGEFTRLILVFLGTLFLSMSAGIFISTVVRDSRQAVVNGLLLVTFFTGVFPLAWWGFQLWSGKNHLNFLLWPSPVFAYIKAFDVEYSRGIGAREFWESFATLLLLGAAALAASSILLPRSWTESGESGAKSSRLKRFFLRGKTFSPIKFNGDFWRKNPFFWLAARDYSPRKAKFILALMLLVVAGLFCVINFSQSVARAEPCFLISIIAAYLAHLLGKTIFVTEASRRMNADRRSGAWELLLVTPVTIEAILSGQTRALLHHFRDVFIILFLINVTMVVTVIDSSANLKMDDDDVALFCEIFAGGMISLPVDFYALSWSGMWNGLKSGKHHHAIIRTFLQVLSPGPVIFFLLMFIQPSVSQRSVKFWIAGWFVVTNVIALIVGRMARSKIKEKFRWAVLQASPS